MSVVAPVLGKTPVCAKTAPGVPVVQDNRYSPGGRYFWSGAGQADAAAGAVVFPVEVPVEEAEDEAALLSEPDVVEDDFADELLPASTDDDVERESVR